MASPDPSRRSWVPGMKVTIATVTTGLGTVGAWIMYMAGWEVPAPVALAVVGIISCGLAYLVPDDEQAGSRHREDKVLWRRREPESW